MTVAVSMSAGVAAVTSAFPSLDPWRIEIAVGLIVVLTLANLRGLKESGSVFALPTYLFITSMAVMILTGLYNIAFGTVVIPPVPHIPHAEAGHAITIFLILRAFAAGCTALTGIEAISDGVPAFQKPESRNASTTLILMVVVLSLMFLGITQLAESYRIIPDGSLEPETEIRN